MPSSWKTFGRTVEIITIVLLVLAVSYLWVNSDWEDAEAPQVTSQAPDAETKTVQQPYRPPMPTVAEPIEVSPPADLYQPPYESPPVYGLAEEMRPCGTDDQFASAVQVEGMVPHEVVEQAIWGIQAKLRSSQDNDVDNPVQLYDLPYEYLLPYYDMRFMGGAVLGKHWRTATANQKDRFVCAFQTIWIRKWATGLSELYENDVEILPSEVSPSKRTHVVRTKAQLDDGSGIPINYNLVNRGGDGAYST